MNSDINRDRTHRTPTVPGTVQGVPHPAPVGGAVHRSRGTVEIGTVPSTVPVPNGTRP